MRLSSLLSAACLLMAAHQAAATSVYYTFEGEVTGVNSFGPLAPALADTIGQKVRYIFVADTDLPGTQTLNGNTSEFPDRTDWSGSYDYFYSDYVGGDAIANDGAGWPSNRAHFTYGFNNVASSVGGQGALYGSNSDESGFDEISVYSSVSFNDWAVGQTGFMGGNSMNDDQNTFVGIYSDLTLVAISNVNPLLNTAPTLTASEPNVKTLWPPDRRMVDIEIRCNAADNGGAVTLSAAVSSNEPQEGMGNGDMAKDWDAVTIDPATGIVRLKLRAERSAQGEGRTYTITLTAKDQAGNTTSVPVYVKVPLNQKKN